MKRIILESNGKTLYVRVFDNKKYISGTMIRHSIIDKYLESAIHKLSQSHGIKDNNIYVYSPNLFKGWMTKVCGKRFTDYIYHYYNFKSIYSFISFKELINDDYISWALENKKFTKCGYVSTTLETIKEYFKCNNLSNSTMGYLLYNRACEHRGRKKVFDIKPIHMIIDNKIAATM